MNENGHDSGVSKIGEMNTSDVFLGDKESWRNNDLQNDEEIYTEIAADQDALYEIIKQVVDSKIAQGSTSVSYICPLPWSATSRGSTRVY